MAKPLTDPLPRPLEAYTPELLEEFARRCEERKAEGFIVSPAAVALLAEAIRALVRERARR